MVASRTKTWRGLVFIVLIFISLLGGKLFLPVVPLDEGILLVYPDLILKGYVPNRDFCSLYPPGNFWLLAMAFKLFGAHILVERMVGFFYFLALPLAIFFLSARENIGIAVLSATLVGVVLRAFPVAIGAYSWFGGMALALWALYLASQSIRLGQQNSYLTFASGFLGGLAILFRYDLGPAILLSGLILAGTGKWRIFIYLGGFLVGALPMIAHLIVASPGAVFENMVLDVISSGPSRRLPLPISNPLLWAVFISCLAPLILALREIFAKPRGSRWRLVSAIAAFSLCILPQALSRADRWHLCYVGCVTLPLLVIALFNSKALLSELSPRLSRLFLEGSRSVTPSLQFGRNTVVVCLVLVVGLAVAYLIFRPVWLELSAFRENGWACATCVQNNGRSVPVRLEDRDNIQGIIDDIKVLAIPGDTLFVGPHDLSRTNYSDAFFYFLLPELRPNSYYIEMASNVTNREGSRLGTDLNKSKFVILNTTYDSWREDNESVKRGSLEPVAILQRNFCLHSSRGPYRLYLRCAAAGRAA